MRLTTRLMQIASWLLLRRAVNEGEMTPARRFREPSRSPCAPGDVLRDRCLAELPPEFVDLCAHSIRLQARVLHLDRSIAASARPASSSALPLAHQIALAAAAFAGAASRVHSPRRLPAAAFWPHGSVRREPSQRRTAR